MTSPEIKISNPDPTIREAIMVAFKENDRKIRRRRAISITAMLFGLLGVVLGSVYPYQRTNQQHNTLETRIVLLTGALNVAAAIISDVEQEVNKRQELLERLQQDADEAKALASLNSPQAGAVVQALRGELDKESNRGWWSSIIQNLIFSILGAIFGVGATESWRWLRRKRPSPPSEEDIHITT
jgi:hypothetical protein